MDTLILLVVSGSLATLFYELLVVTPRNKETQEELDEKTEELSELRDKMAQQELELVDLKRDNTHLVLWHLLALRILKSLELDKTEEDKPEQVKSQEEEE